MRNLVAAMALALGACASLPSGGSVGNVSLTAAPTAAGDSIVLTLANRSAQSVGYNLCVTAVERRNGDTWQNVPVDRVCTKELRTLDAGDQTTYTTTLPAGAAAGDYRFATSVQIPLSGEQQTVTSNVVRVAS
jgi:hypothetical protein